MLKYLPLITTILVVSFTALVSSPASPLLINGMTQADISEMYRTAITPAGFTFSIWSLIYLSWIILAIALVAKKTHLKKKEILTFSGAMILTALWLIPWGYNWIGTAFVVMLILLVTLWYLFSLVRDGDRYTRGAVELFMGWIHIATFANLAVWLKYIGIDSLDVNIGIAILTIAFFATLFFQLRYRTYIVTLVYLWATIGIWVRQPQSLLHTFLLVYALLMGGAMLMTYMRSK